MISRVQAPLRGAKPRAGSRHEALSADPRLAARGESADDATWRERVEEYVDLRAVHDPGRHRSFLAENDGLLGDDGMNNFFLYRPAGSKRHRFLPWDKDNSFLSPDYSIFERADENVLFPRAFAYRRPARAVLSGPRVSCPFGRRRRLARDGGRSIGGANRGDRGGRHRKPFSTEAFFASVEWLKQFARHGRSSCWTRWPTPVGADEACIFGREPDDNRKELPTAPRRMVVIELHKWSPSNGRRTRTLDSRTGAPVSVDAAEDELERKLEKKRAKVRSAWISFVGRIVAQVMGAVATISLGLILVQKYHAPAVAESAAQPDQPVVQSTIPVRFVTPGETSLAVLPLRDVSTDGEESFARGMTDALITDLARLEWSASCRGRPRRSTRRSGGGCQRSRGRSASISSLMAR